MTDLDDVGAPTASDAPALSLDGRYAAKYSDDWWEPGLVVEDRSTERSCFVPAGYYSRRWPVGGPWWSPDGDWLLCSWYTTKVFDHGWISAISRESLEHYFATSVESSLTWTVTGYPNGVPYPEHPDEVGSYEAVPVAAFSADASAVYFVDTHTVSGFSFPHMVPLFRVARPELATVRQTVPLPTTEVPFTTWTSHDRLVVATREGRVGSIWLGLGLAWIPERETGSQFLAFDAEASTRVALTDSGALLWWDEETEPHQIGSFPELVVGPCAVKFLDPDTVIVGGVGGDLLLVGRDGRVKSTMHTGLRDVSSLQISADRSYAAAVSSERHFQKVQMISSGPKLDPSLSVQGVVHVAFADGDNLMLVDSEDFLHLGPEEKRHVNSDGSLGAATGPEIAVVFMNEILSGDDSGGGVLALACHPGPGVAVATRSGVVGQFDPASEAAITTHLGGDVAETLQFSPDGTVLMAAGRSGIHLLTLFS